MISLLPGLHEGLFNSFDFGPYLPFPLMERAIALMKHPVSPQRSVHRHSCFSLEDPQARAVPPPALSGFSRHLGCTARAPAADLSHRRGYERNVRTLGRTVENLPFPVSPGSPKGPTSAGGSVKPRRYILWTFRTSLSPSLAQVLRVSRPVSPFGGFLAPWQRFSVSA